jgi:hypothetical protein
MSSSAKKAEKASVVTVSAEGSQEGQVAIIDPQTLDISNALGLLEKEIESLNEITDSKYKAGSSLDGFGNIQTCTDISTLIKAASSIRSREKSYLETAEDLGLRMYPKFNLNGGSSDDWMHDIKLRINILTHHEKLEKLKSYREEMKTLITKEERKAMLFKDMATYLNQG